MRRHIIILSSALLFCSAVTAAEKVPLPRERPAAVKAGPGDNPCSISRETLELLKPPRDQRPPETQTQLAPPRIERLPCESPHGTIELLKPLPRERPTEAEIARPVDAAEIVPSACRVALEAIAEIKPLPERKGPGACGGTDMVSLETVRLADGAPVTISPPAELRCEMATDLANWIRDKAAPIFAPSRLIGIANYDSYECRGRNRVAGAKVSEHGKGNAIDIRAFVLAGNKMISPVDYKVAPDLRENLKASACKSFTTVLGPGSDGYHEQHIHFDIAARHGGYRICQWAVRDKPVEVAAVIPLPRPRPGDEVKLDKPE